MQDNILCRMRWNWDSVITQVHLLHANLYVRIRIAKYHLNELAAADISELT